MKIAKARKQVFTVAFLAALVLVSLVLVSPYLNSVLFSLWPGTEGLSAGVVGYQTAPSDYGLVGYWGTNESFPLTNPSGGGILSPRYRWSQWPVVDPYNTLITRTDDYFGRGALSQTLLVERQTPTRDELSAGKKIDYWIHDTDPQGNARSTEIVGTVVPWVFTMQISLVPGSDSGDPFFQNGEAVWLGLGTVKWNRAYGAPSDDYTNYAGHSIPLAVYIESYNNGFENWPNNDKSSSRMPDSGWVTSCVQLTPTLGGRTVTLFTDPETPVTLDDVWYQGGMDTTGISNALDSMNGTLFPDPSPDSRFANHAYFKFSFTKFQPHEEDDYWGNHVATWFPSVSYRLRVYYLELGAFTYVTTQEDLPWWDVRNWSLVFTPVRIFWDAVFGAIGILNPFSIFGPYGTFVAFLFTLFIAAIIILVLIAVFAPWALPRIFGGMRQARDFAYESIEKRPGQKRPRRKSRSQK